MTLNKENRSYRVDNTYFFVAELICCQLLIKQANRQMPSEYIFLFV